MPTSCLGSHHTDNLKLLKALGYALGVCLLVVLLASTTTVAYAEGDSPAEPPSTEETETEPAGGSDNAETGDPQPEIENPQSTIPDPYFFVDGVKHSYLPSEGNCQGAENCAVSTTPIQDAINAVSGGMTPDDGVIYIEGGNYAENVSLQNLDIKVL